MTAGIIWIKTQNDLTLSWSYILFCWYGNKPPMVLSVSVFDNTLVWIVEWHWYIFEVVFSCWFYCLYPPVMMFDWKAFWTLNFEVFSYHDVFILTLNGHSLNSILLQHNDYDNIHSCLNSHFHEVISFSIVHQFTITPACGSPTHRVIYKLHAATN